MKPKAKSPAALSEIPFPLSYKVCRLGRSRRTFERTEAPSSYIALSFIRIVVMKSLIKSLKMFLVPWIFKWLLVRVIYWRMGRLLTMFPKREVSVKFKVMFLKMICFMVYGEEAKR